MLKGKTALITGTNRGIGKALAVEFAKNGANVIAHARRETPEFVQMCADLAKEHGVSVTPLFFDMTDSDAMKTAVRNLVSAKTPIDVLVNNAGVAHGGLFQMTSMAKIREIFDVNLFSQMELTQLVLRVMVRRKGGSIVNMGVKDEDGNVCYIIGLLKSIRNQLFHLKVNETANGGRRHPRSALPRFLCCPGLMLRYSVISRGLSCVYPLYR